MGENLKINILIALLMFFLFPALLDLQSDFSYSITTT
jgi:hypothetical protein